jgi:hypothetical protein
MARQYRSTVQAKTLQAAINNSVATMTLNSTTSLPNSYPYTLVIDNDLATEEIVTVTASGGGNSVVITRGQDGTSAQAHDAGAVVKHMITARDLQEPQDHIDNTTTAHSMNLKAPLASPTFTGTVVLPSTTSIGTITAAELGYVDGVTSAIQTQIDTKSPSASPTFTGTVVLPSTTSIGTVSSTEIGYVDGVTSAIQTQLTAGTTALTTHAALTLNAHGIADTSKLPKIASASAGRTIFVQAATPTALAIGDIWFQVTGL